MGTFARDSRRVAPVFPNPGVRNLPFQKPYSGAYLTLQVLHFLQKCAIARLIPRVHTHSRPSPGRSPGGRTLVCVLMCVCCECSGAGSVCRLRPRGSLAALASPLGHQSRSVACRFRRFAAPTPEGLRPPGPALQALRRWGAGRHARPRVFSAPGGEACCKEPPAAAALAGAGGSLQALPEPFAARPSRTRRAARGRTTHAALRASESRPPPRKYPSDAF